MDPRQALIEAAFADRSLLKNSEHRESVESVLADLDAGRLRVASPPAVDGEAWTVHAWVKQAILLYFGIRAMEKIEVGPFEFYDKIPLKKNRSNNKPSHGSRRRRH